MTPLHVVALARWAAGLAILLAPQALMLGMVACGLLQSFRRRR